MTDIQFAKRLVRDYYAALDAADGDAVGEVFARYLAPRYRWRGFHPFHELSDAGQVADRFWAPLKEALQPLQRRHDIFIAGRNQVDDFATTWVISMGHLCGLFDAPWLDIPPTGRLAMLRYCEFNRVTDGRIDDTAMFFDIPHLMQQAGLDPFPAQTGARLVQPGPSTHRGLCFDPSEPAAGKRTLAAIDRMIDDLRQWQQHIPIEEELARSWHHDMLWWGPAGIGATFTIERYIAQHVRPFRSAFVERRFNGHVCKLAEGEFGGFFGWPNLTLTPRGRFLGLQTAGVPGDMRVIDMYRRSGDRLAENWIFIDLLHFFDQQGVDLLARMRAGS